MLVVTLIATIIHMNMGFKLPEALGRGFASALIIGAVCTVLYLLIALIIGVVNHSRRDW